MSKTNRVLLLAVAALLALSVYTWRADVGRADRFERGQRFLPNLNPDEIARVAIVGEEESVTLERSGDRFTVTEKAGYPAANDAVNRLVQEILELSLEKEIGAGAELEEELGIEPPIEGGVEVSLANVSGQEMVRFRVGESFADGSYLQRRDEEGATIFLASRRVDLAPAPGDLLDKVVVDVERGDIVRIEGSDFILANDEAGELALAEPRAGETAAQTEISGLRGLLSPLRLDEVWVADDPEVSGLEFVEALRMDLADGSGYVLSAAIDGERHFLRIRGFHTVERVEIALDTPDAELEEKAETLSRADEIETFNEFHGSWVYEMGEWVGEKVAAQRADLLGE